MIQVENPIIPSDEFNFMLKSITEESLSEIEYLKNKKKLERLGTQIYFFSADDFLEGRKMDTLEVFDNSLRADELEKIGVEYAYNGNFVPVCVFFSELKKKDNDNYFTVTGQTFDGRSNMSNIKIAKTKSKNKRLKYDFFERNKEIETANVLQKFYRGFSTGLIMKKLSPFGLRQPELSLNN